MARGLFTTGRESHPALKTIHPCLYLNTRFIYCKFFTVLLTFIKIKSSKYLELLIILISLIAQLLGDSIHDNRRKLMSLT